MVRVSYSLVEAARVLGVSPKTVQRLISAGSLRSFTVGRRRLVSAADLIALVARDNNETARHGAKHVPRTPEAP